jgi:hypothetical protein
MWPIPRDRRKRRVCIQKALITVNVIVWMVTISYSESSLTEHSTEIINGQWWIIGGLVALIQTITMAFYAYSQQVNSRTDRAILESIRALNQRMDDRDKILHELHGEHRMMMRQCRSAREDME